MLLQRLRDLREDMDLYQKDIADYLHCSQVTYSRYELGTREIPLESLNALADFYGVSIDYLMGRTDEKKALSAKKKAVEKILQKEYYAKSNQRFKRRCRFDAKAGGTVFTDVTDRLFQIRNWRK